MMLRPWENSPLLQRMAAFLARTSGYSPDSTSDRVFVETFPPRLTVAGYTGMTLVIASSICTVTCRMVEEFVGKATMLPVI